jgi:hypothetical protein
MNRKERARLLVEDIVRVARELGAVPSQRVYLSHPTRLFDLKDIRNIFSSWTTATRAAGLAGPVELKPQAPEPAREAKILVWDIETAPILGYVWSLWEQNVALNQIKSDWHLLSWAAKWLGKPEVLYMDQRNAKNIEDDKAILSRLWKLLDEADCVITQNGKAFDQKKINARFILNGMGPPSPYKHIDTKQLAKKHFAFTSNKLEYMAEKLCKQQKLKHKEFIGFDLWKECLAGNERAWEEMRHYNTQDVLATEELYLKLSPWGGSGVNLNTFHSAAEFRCQCGSNDFASRGHGFNQSGKYRKFSCKQCGAWHSEAGAKNNLFSEAKKISLKTPKEK